MPDIPYSASAAPDGVSLPLTKNDGSSRIQRSGRFGVGALAAFLLGDEISVETRHYSERSESGLKFSATIDTSSINVVRGSYEVGTKISIPVPERLQEKVGRLIPHFIRHGVDQNYGIGNYFGRYPSLVYTIDGEKLPWNKNCLLPTRQTAFEDPWNYFEASDFEVNWTYASDAVGLAVNQILISGENRHRQSRAANAGVELHSHIFSEPSLSIGDNSGSFELNLQRNTYAGSELPFFSDLLREITDEFIFGCLWQLANYNDRHFPRYSGLVTRRYSEARWLDCSDGVILNEPTFLKTYSPIFCINRYGGGPDPKFFQKIVGALPPKSIYFHNSNDEFTERQFSMKGKLSRMLDGEALAFIRATTKSQSIFVPKAFVDLIIKSMKPGKNTLKTLESLNEDIVSGWLVQSGENISEPAEVRKWREGMDKDGKDTCVVSLHSLSCQSYEIKEGNDKIIFDRWMELLGQPYLPRSGSDLAALQRELSKKIGQKYTVFERRMKEVMKKEEAEQREK